MLSRDAVVELCCFGATCSAAATFLLAVFALDLTVEAAVSRASLSLIIAAGVAFMLMIVFTVIAVELQRNSSGPGACEDSNLGA
jgi:hypothetical protein